MAATSTATGSWPDPGLIARARHLVADGSRRILGITGAPGAGKSTLAAALAEALGPVAAVAPMDGFHLRQAEIDRLGLADRKGAPETFDVAGYVALLRELRSADHDVAAPAYDRGIEEPVPGVLVVPSAARLVITEGNYLLLAEDGWGEVADLLDEVWYAETAEQTRISRLARRHRDSGKAPAQAEAWTHGSDQRNADLVAGTRQLADLVVSVPSG